MLEIESPAELGEWRRAERRQGRTIGFVPTMGYLHEGHLALVDAARMRADRVVMSIFVNPLQFGPSEDLSRYPRDLPRDRALAAGRGVDLLFVPTAETMYPPGFGTRVVPGPAAERWEGAFRPGHFAGVLTVVAKLCHLVTPDVACFGQKDMQQAMLVRQMLRDLDWPLELVVVPTVREPDGLALSSRNAYLDPPARTAALALSRALARASAAWRSGVVDSGEIEAAMRQVLEVSAGVSVDYIAVTSPNDLTPVTRADAGSVVVIAARVGGIRLIDNIILAPGIGSCSAT